MPYSVMNLIIFLISIKYALSLSDIHLHREMEEGRKRSFRLSLITSSMISALKTTKANKVVFFGNNTFLENDLIERTNKIGKTAIFSNGQWLNEWSSNPEMYEYVIYTSSLNYVKDTLLKSRKLKILGPLFNWLIYMENYDFKEIEKAFTNLLYPGDSILLLIENNGIIEYYQWFVGNFRLIGHFTRDKIRKNAPFFLPFHGFYGREFTIVATPLDFLQFRIVRKGKVFYVGIFFNIFNMLAERLKFRYRIIEPKEAAIGTLINGTYNGAMGMIYRKEADIGVGAFTVTAQRLKAVDFLSVTQTEALTILMKRPNPQLLSSVFFTQTFKIEVWMCFISSVTLSFVALLFFSKYNLKEEGFGLRVKSFDEDYSLFRHCFWYAFGAAINQGGILPSVGKTSVRALVGSMWLTWIMITAIYTGNLVAIMSVRKYKLPVNNLEDAVSNKDFKLIILGNSGHETIFKTADSGVFKKAWEKIIQDPQENIVPDLKTGIEKAKQENTGYISTRSVVNLVSHLDCELTTTDEKYDFLPNGVTFAVQKGWGYQNLFNKILLEISLEPGLNEKWLRTYNLTQNPSCKDSDSTESNAIDLATYSGSFYIIAIGFGLALLSITIEFIKSYLHFKKLRRTIHSNF
ncbi:DgyrCDS8629 [Dimorphilus gyrociliatus]|uniref:DgyrCDS8629 n=1 Tax=Dimorphilus gyrociliatus TaxID=2664684 RepID=A0A7I8VWX1_9ANNE|nr:DgyrCDS8629 [Dimorphilus gyrociliatus]